MYISKHSHRNTASIALVLEFTSEGCASCPRLVAVTASSELTRLDN